MTSERLHVLFFTASLGLGGAEKHMVRLANGLDRARFRVSVAVVRGGGSYERELAGDVAYHPLGAGRMMRARGPLRALVRRTRPDVVCAFNDQANAVAILATRRLPGGPAVVAGVQNPFADLRNPPQRLRKRAVLAVLPLLYPRADRVVALSAGVRDEVEALSPRLRGRVALIPNAGVDGSVEALSLLPPEDAPPAGGPVVVACGRLTEQKGYGDLLEAFRRVRERVPASLWVLGQGHLREELEARAEGLGIAGSVHFLGFRDNPYACMRAADVFALSSLWEGFGNVIVEAMAVGTPVVSTDCPYGPAEIIRDGTDGLLVPPGDPEAMARALVRVLEDPALRERLRAGGLRRARDFGAEAVAERYGALFEEVAAERRGRPSRLGVAA